MIAINSVLCALDPSPIAPRVLRHAVGVAGALGARLTVLAVSQRDSGPHDAATTAWLRDAVSAASTVVGDVSLRVVRLAMGEPVDVILGAAESGVDLIVAGTHGKSDLTRWFLGSTSAALLADTRCPTLLVPPGQADIVALDGDRARLTPTAILAAVDLDEQNERQVAMASFLAARAQCPLVALNVAADGASLAAAEQAVAARLTSLGLAPAARVMVRQGSVPREIDRAAIEVQAGLVVMGLRERGARGQLATAVLTGNHAAVLGVPLAARA